MEEWSLPRGVMGICSQLQYTCTPLPSQNHWEIVDNCKPLQRLSVVLTHVAYQEEFVCGKKLRLTVRKRGRSKGAWQRRLWSRKVWNPWPTVYMYVQQKLLQQQLSVCQTDSSRELKAEEVRRLKTIMWRSLWTCFYSTCYKVNGWTLTLF